MALFKRKDKVSETGETPRGSNATPQSPQGVRPLVGKRAYCRICNAEQDFSRCWKRMDLVQKCPECGAVFSNPEELYKKFQPSCPRCGSPLEQPGFDYGLCDGCGSRYELVDGTKPGLLPNQKQREAMNRVGKAREID